MRVLIFFLSLMTIASALGAQNRGPAPSAGAAAGDAQATPAGDAQNGKKIFASHGCYQCHGYAAQGGAAPRLAPRPLAFTALSRYVRQPTGEMPPYTAKVLRTSNWRISTPSSGRCPNRLRWIASRC